MGKSWQMDAIESVGGISPMIVYYGNLHMGLNNP